MFFLPGYWSSITFHVTKNGNFHTIYFIIIIIIIIISFVHSKIYGAEILTLGCIISRYGKIVSS
jgi:hypothetical protein